ncbi:MAG: DUF4112 domain-containing protein [Oscillatoria sp. PMC 1068.18]|nr:DUF4112 domain-containing protein [Oscillatoria sp. PMC 1076.18]MEC4990946.1 DUF4112 domain-containing protein [Oscillatoria sp. PMC 1068.18]
MTHNHQPPLINEKHQQRLARVRSLSYLLDNAIGIPGTNYRIGLDPLLGLFPAAGDYVGSAISAYIVLEAARLGVSRNLLLQMAGNIILETLVGTVPMLGDLFDAAWKANSKNIALLEEHLGSPQPQQRRKTDWLFLGLFFAILLIVVIGTTLLSLYLLSLLFQALSS